MNGGTLRTVFSKVSENCTYKFEVSNTALIKVTNDIVEFNDHINVDTQSHIVLQRKSVGEDNMYLFDEFAVEFKKVFDKIITTVELYFDDDAEFKGIRFYKPNVLEVKFKIDTDSYIFLEFDENTLALNQDW